MADAVATWAISTDAKVTIQGVKDDTGAPILDGVVAAVLQDSQGNPVINASALAFTYVSGSSGDYAGIIPANVDLLDGRDYTLVITITKSSRQAVIKMTRTAAFVTI